LDPYSHDDSVSNSFLSLYIPFMIWILSAMTHEIFIMTFRDLSNCKLEREC